MKRKNADRETWSRLLKSQFQSNKSSDYNGMWTRIDIFKIREPLFVTYNNVTQCIVQEGYSWIQLFPKGELYTITAVVDEKGQIIQWYLDVCWQHGINEKGIPWYDDLYLDLVILPTGDYFILDEDELQEALDLELINQEQFDSAYQTLFKLIEMHKSGSFSLLKISENYKMQASEKVDSK
ncbi:putative RNA-binding protein associated with RNAse of E/G family [Peribacillus deserti]|uniref:RNA-binding protein associated with RNAse of E/G family n=1 Tax=Peribacillus deserti TaxID=673318 RepID=A0ABS2QHT4_9BACI|nr:DUF402 domain-containing protein [Peribacillus deserti]MBM7692721.1 putative RNA-binding protein associated with RNAse of E/G family [Peribacillus deserti]